MAEPLSLAQAQALIQALVMPTDPEQIPLEDVLERVVATEVRAPMPVPAFCRSTMDGYAVKSRDLATASLNQPVRLQVTDEIPAGRIDLPTLHAGEAIRVMTGAALPAGADQVVPFELCREEPAAVLIDRPGARWRHIRRCGSDLKQGEILLRPGSIIAPEQLPNLAECGLHSLPVFRQPRVAFLCTGSELLDLGSTVQPGRIIGGNRYLLAALIRQARGVAVDLGLVRDSVPEISSRLQPDLKVDMVISTGGMGPGDYDLLPEVYRRLSITTHYDSLEVRPGRATMFGSKNGRFFFALPGPPPAVRLLFHELVRPALLALQGINRPLPRAHTATLTQPLSVTKAGIQNLKGGVYTWQTGQPSVRLARKNEPFNAIILIPKHRRHLRPGERVTIHPIGWP